MICDERDWIRIHFDYACSSSLYYSGADRLCIAPRELVREEWGSLTLDNFTCQGTNIIVKIVSY